MKHNNLSFYRFITAIVVIASLLGNAQAQTPGTWVQPAKDVWPNVFVWKDTCNVYALRDGNAAVLIALCRSFAKSSLSFLFIRDTKHSLEALDSGIRLEL